MPGTMPLLNTPKISYITENLMKDKRIKSDTKKRHVQLVQSIIAVADSVCFLILYIFLPLSSFHKYIYCGHNYEITHG